MLRCALGIDVGSVSTNLVLLDEKNDLLKTLYKHTAGNPIKAIKGGLLKLKRHKKYRYLCSSTRAVEDS